MGLGPVFGLHHFGFWVDDIEDTRRPWTSLARKYRFGRPETATNELLRRDSTKDPTR